MGEIIGHDGGNVTFSVKEFREKWCLYGHALAPKPEIFFLGTCRLMHVYDFSEAFRNSHWRKTVKQDTVITISILATMDNPIDANRALRMMYNDLRPEANVHGYLVSGKSVVSCTQGDNIGQTWETSTECARQNGISPGTLSNHLNGRPGYEHIRGMKFKRGMP